MNAEANGFTDRTEVSVGKIYQRDDSVLEIIVIDDRSCIREAIAASIRGDNRKIIAIESTADMVMSELYEKAPARQIILLCDGSSESEPVEDEISALKEYTCNANLALLTDQQVGELRFVLQSQPLISVIPSHYSTDQLLACIRLIESGINYLPAEVPRFYNSSVSNHTHSSSTELSAMLTPRQREVMEYIFEGRSNKYIAAELSVSESTIKVHVHEAMKRLGATSRTHATYLLKICQTACPG